MRKLTGAVFSLARRRHAGAGRARRGPDRRLPLRRLDVRPSGTRAWSGRSASVIDGRLRPAARQADLRHLRRLLARYNRDNPIGEQFQRINKYVLTHSDEPLDWENSHKLSGDTAAAVAELKQSEGRDLLIQGSSTLYPPLLAAGLIDRLVADDLPGGARAGQVDLRRLANARRAQAGRPLRLRQGRRSSRPTSRPAKSRPAPSRPRSRARHELERREKIKEGTW